MTERLVVELDGLSVRYGNVTAVDGLSLAVPNGSVYALLGRNGSGKSSTVRCMLGQQKPSGGGVRVLGVEAWHDRCRIMERVGVVPENPDVPPATNAERVERFLAWVTPHWKREEFFSRLERFGVPKRQRFDRLSKGQQRQFALALALSSAPQLLVLDDGMLSVYSLADEHLLTAVRLPRELRNSTIFFLDPERLRLYGRSPEHEGHSVHIAEVEVPTGRLDRTGEILDLPEHFWTAFDAKVEIMVIGSTVEEPLLKVRDIREARSGERIRTFDGSLPQLLANGRLAYLRDGEDGQLQLVVESPDGLYHAEHDLGFGGEARLGGETGAGQLLILRDHIPAHKTEASSAVLIRIESGRQQALPSGVGRNRTGFQWKTGALGASFWYVNRPEAGCLFTDQQDALVRWDPTTGELDQIVGGMQ